MAARIVRYGLAWLGCTLAVPVAAQPVLDPLFGDGAVLQREQPIDIRGRASPARPSARRWVKRRKAPRRIVTGGSSLPSLRWPPVARIG